MSIYDSSGDRRGTEHPARSALRRTKGLGSAAALLITALMTASQASAQAFPTWVSPRLARVGVTDAPGTTTSINLSSGRGETVATQVIVRAPSGGLTNVNLSASALSGPGGATIAASNITLYREFYVTINRTTNYGNGNNPPPSLDSGTYAEPLIPFNDPQSGLPLCGNGAALQACNASVVAGQNQPYWSDIFVPRGVANSPAGSYTGSINITADQGS